MEREEPAAAPVAAAESPVGRSKVGTVVEASAPADAPEVSPLQALVQDIMQQQKQRAQVHTRASWFLFCVDCASDDIDIFDNAGGMKKTCSANK